MIYLPFEFVAERTVSDDNGPVKFASDKASSFAAIISL